MKRALTIGTRGSDLALWQSRRVRELLLAAHPDLEVGLKVISTQGDRSANLKLVGTLEKGFFTQELEAELVAGTIDLAVHSLKDLPTRLDARLTIGAILARAAPYDVLLTPERFLAKATPKTTATTLPLQPGTTVGASSLRRENLIKTFAPSAQHRPFRGNVPTRVKKLVAGDVDAIVLAGAGVERLGLDLAGLAVLRLNPVLWQPAPGQGAIAVQSREGDSELERLLAPLECTATRRSVEWEREFLRELEGGCTTPFGCYVDGDTCWLGLATSQGWSARQVALPARADRRASFIRTTLAALAREPGGPMPTQVLHEDLYEEL